MKKYEPCSAACNQKKQIHSPIIKNGGQKEKRMVWIDYAFLFDKICVGGNFKLKEECNAFLDLI